MSQGSSTSLGCSFPTAATFPNGLERFSEEISEMVEEILALDEAEGTGNIRSDLSRVRQRRPAAKDLDPFWKFILRTAQVLSLPADCPCLDFNPEGIAHRSPGLRVFELPWGANERGPTPKGLRPFINELVAHHTREHKQRVGLRLVARASSYGALP